MSKLYYYQIMNGDRAGEIVSMKYNQQLVIKDGIRYESLAMPRTNQTAINTYKVMEGLK